MDRAEAIERLASRARFGVVQVRNHSMRIPTALQPESFIFCSFQNL